MLFVPLFVPNRPIYAQKAFKGNEKGQGKSHERAENWKKLKGEASPIGDKVAGGEENNGKRTEEICLLENGTKRIECQEAMAN
jgi:hypothetical protein